MEKGMLPCRTRVLLLLVAQLLAWLLVWYRRRDKYPCLPGLAQTIIVTMSFDAGSIMMEHCPTNDLEHSAPSLIDVGLTTTS